MHHAKDVIEAKSLISTHGRTCAVIPAPKLPGIYALLFRGDPGRPCLEVDGGALVRIGSATRDIGTRLRTLVRILNWDGFSTIRHDLRSGGLPDWMASLPARPKLEDFRIAIACGAHPQNAERLTYEVARDLTGSPPPANRCLPGVYQKEKLNWLAGREEGGFSLAQLLLGDHLDDWLAKRGRA